ncbi:hypothetical protein QVD17_00395 [Tagetes erecta]|uniref:Uncharacterized protein n=1 Tax=Tagetes erecta TaxID=13708 RepID=A0AAD8L8P7_TARER|nr:hypothetical protein QVD17_00395 [Tagetes erecta]
MSAHVSHPYPLVLVGSYPSLKPLVTSTINLPWVADLGANRVNTGQGLKPIYSNGSYKQSQSHYSRNFIPTTLLSLLHNTLTLTLNRRFILRFVIQLRPLHNHRSYSPICNTESSRFIRFTNHRSYPTKIHSILHPFF